MKFAISIPKLGLTMEDAILVEWGFSNGSAVFRGQTVMTIETDKIMFDVEAEQDGFLQHVATVGEKLLVGDLAGYIHPSAEEAISSVNSDTLASSTTNRQDEYTEIAVVDEKSPSRHPAYVGARTDGSGQRLMASPVAKILAKTRSIELEKVTASGPGGVILKRDVEAAIANKKISTNKSQAVDTLTRRPMTAMRKAIAQRMMQSLATKAQMTGFSRIDMTQATNLRESLVSIAQTLGVRITFTDIVLKAAATVLAEMPEMNAWIDGDDVVSLNAVNIGLAVSVNGGLIVPVIRHVDQLTLVELSMARMALIEKARMGKLSRQDIEGGTFTLSNFGSYAGNFETPILNGPQSALLGIGQISDEPVVRDKQIVIRPMMPVSLTFDHCLIDGAMAGEFRSRFMSLLEQPAFLLTQIR